MSDLPRLSILLLTYKRLDLTLRTIESTVRNMLYSPESVGWYLCDDGSPTKEYKQIEKFLLDGCAQNIIGGHNERIRAKRHEDSFFAGKSYNLGLGICHQWSDYVLVLENDWDLDEPLDLVPHIKLLRDNDKVGAVTFRILSTGADVHTVGYNGQMYLQYLRSTQYAFSGNPYIRHARFTKEYGWFSEEKNPGDMELHQDDMYRYRETEHGKFIPRNDSDGPQIWRPAEISIWGSWKHIGSEKSWS